MRQIIIIAGLFLIVGGLTARYVDQTMNAPRPPAAMVAAEPPAPANSRTVTIPRDRQGHFQVEGRVDGKRMGFMVDTGASVIALTASDAAKLGIRPTEREFNVEVKTANGSVRAARTQLNRVEIQDITVRDVAALVVPDAALSENLLGLSFLAKLRRFEYQNGKLVLEQ